MNQKIVSYSAFWEKSIKWIIIAIMLVKKKNTVIQANMIERLLCYIL